MKSKIKNRTINSDVTILQSLKKMDEEHVKLLFVFNEDKFIGILTIGDIQRAIIKNVNLNDSVISILDTKKIYANINDDIEYIKGKMYRMRAECMPVVDNKGLLKDVIYWEEVFGNEKKEPYFKFNLPIIIMAGGIGSRLRPLTNVLPKPLIPIKDKTLLEEIFKRFSDYGCNDFYVSLNYKSKLIEYYIDQQNLPYNIIYFLEDKPMGTVGSLSLIKEKIHSTFFVSNCDIIIDQDYSEILDYHKKNKNEITIVATLKHIAIPYGTIETGENGQLIELIEKPELTLKINSGMYILEPHLLNEIPNNHFFHITQLINNIKKRKGKIGVFPINASAWKDIGNWQEYLNIIK